MRLQTYIFYSFNACACLSIKLTINQTIILIPTANYYRSRGELAKAEAFCALLVDFVGPEGDEARAIVRDIRSIAITRYQQRSASSANANSNSVNKSQQHQQQHQSQTLRSFTHTRTPEHRGFMPTTPGPGSAVSNQGTPSDFDPDDMAGHLSMSSDGGN